MSKRVKKDQLVEVAKELNNVLGLEPAIDVKKSNSKILQKKIYEAGEFIDPVEDEFTESTWTILESLGAAHRSTKSQDQKEMDAPAQQEEVTESEEANSESKEQEEISESVDEVEKQEQQAESEIEEATTEENTTTELEAKPVVETTSKTQSTTFKREGSMSEYVDTMMEKKEQLDTIIENTIAEAKNRGVKSMNTPGSVKAHIRYRKKKGQQIAEDYDV
jgi:cobalamin biosynthesis protein CobT